MFLFLHYCPWSGRVSSGFSEPEGQEFLRKLLLVCSLSGDLFLLQTCSPPLAIEPPVFALQPLALLHSHKRVHLGHLPSLLAGKKVSETKLVETRSLDSKLSSNNGNKNCSQNQYWNYLWTQPWKTLSNKFENQSPCSTACSPSHSWWPCLSALGRTSHSTYRREPQTKILFVF